MPLIRLETDISMDKERKIDLAGKLSVIVSEKTCKPEKYEMASISSCEILLSGESGSSALVQVMSIGGLNSSVNGSIAVAVSELLEETLGIPSDRIYITFTDVPGENWAWKGKTFR